MSTPPPVVVLLCGTKLLEQSWAAHGRAAVEIVRDIFVRPTRRPFLSKFFSPTPTRETHHLQLGNSQAEPSLAESSKPESMSVCLFLSCAHADAPNGGDNDQSSPLLSSGSSRELQLFVVAVVSFGRRGRRRRRKEDGFHLSPSSRHTQSSRKHARDLCRNNLLNLSSFGLACCRAPLLASRRI